MSVFECGQFAGQCFLDQFGTESVDAESYFACHEWVVDLFAFERDQSFLARLGCQVDDEGNHERLVR